MISSFNSFNSPKASAVSIAPILSILFSLFNIVLLGMRNDVYIKNKVSFFRFLRDFNDLARAETPSEPSRL